METVLLRAVGIGASASYFASVDPASFQSYTTVMDLVEGVIAMVLAKFIFFPTKVLALYPSQTEMPYEEVRLKNEEGQLLHGWFFPGKKERTLLYLHGNAGNIGDRLDKIRFLRRIGWSLFIVDYRGYGGSEGSPTVAGVLKDTDTAYLYLTQKKKIPPEQVILFGESLGGAMAIDLASREPLGGMILESTFTSLRDMARFIFPIIPTAIAPDSLRSLSSIRRIKSPLLVIHGTKDETVPYEMGKRLFEAAPHPKRFYTVPGAMHNDAYVVGNLEYLKQIEEFLAGVGLP